jgi:hypothetical protein
MLGESPLQIIARYQSGAPIDTEGLARELGLKVYRDPLERGVYGKLTKDPAAPSGFAIYVNSFDAPVRQRFTIAHEIAHYVLHRDLINDEIVDREMYRSRLSNEYETQANRLAAEILMPSDLVRREFARDQDWESLARRFKVSPAAMEIRLQGLRLL